MSFECLSIADKVFNNQEKHSISIRCQYYQPLLPIDIKRAQSQTYLRLAQKKWKKKPNFAPSVCYCNIEKNTIWQR